MVDVVSKPLQVEFTFGSKVTDLIETVFIRKSDEYIIIKIIRNNVGSLQSIIQL